MYLIDFISDAGNEADQLRGWRIDIDPLQKRSFYQILF